MTELDPKALEAAARAMCSRPDECVFGSGWTDGLGGGGYECSRYAWQDKLGSAETAIRAYRAAMPLGVSEEQVERAREIIAKGIRPFQGPDKRIGVAVPDSVVRAALEAASLNAPVMYDPAEAAPVSGDGGKALLDKEDQELQAYIDNHCQGDDPVKYHARTFAEGRLAEVTIIRSRLAALAGEVKGEPVAVKALELTYTNYRGETSTRTITPKKVWFGATEWHPEPQWLLLAFDHDKQALRDFALKDFGGAGEVKGEPVAWRWRFVGDDEWWFTTTESAASAPDTIREPLFTAPQEAAKAGEGEP